MHNYLQNQFIDAYGGRMYKAMMKAVETNSYVWQTGFNGEEVYVCMLFDCCMQVHFTFPYSVLIDAIKQSEDHSEDLQDVARRAVIYRLNMGHMPYKCEFIEDTDKTQLAIDFFWAVIWKQ